MIGKKVKHSKFGYGEIIQIRNKGFELQVKFEDGLTRWIRYDELRLIEEIKITSELKEGSEINHSSYGKGRIVSIKPQINGPDNSYLITVDFENIGYKYLIYHNKKREKVSEEKPSDLEKKRDFKSRRIIEAFRLGIVPYDYVDEFTFGRDNETKNLSEWMNDSKQNIMCLIGEYGTGKTHLIHYLNGFALKNDYAVSWIEMDPNEVPFHKPKKVYSNIIKNFKYRSKQNNQVKGFRDFLYECLKKGAFKDHIYFKYFFEFGEKEIFWEWIEGKETVLRPFENSINEYGYNENKYKFVPGLYNYSNTVNIYCYLLSSLGWAAKEVLGLKGLLLSFDEAETIIINYYNYQLKEGKNFLDALIRIGNNDSNLLNRPNFSNLEYCCMGISQKIPFLYKIPSGLKILFAFAINVNYNLPKLYLSPLTDRHLKEVFEKVYEYYKNAYNFFDEKLNIDKKLQEIKQEVSGTRLFLKGSVEALDLVRFNKKI